MQMPEEENRDSTLTPEEAKQIIHSHRKVRYGTACWPCRQRKVKCDNKQPCENCVRRDHAALCSYNPKQRPPKEDPALAATGVKRKHSPHSESSSRKGEDRWPRNHDDDATELRYIGQNSIAALLSEEVQAQETSGDGEHDVIRQDIMPILGLEVSSAAPYPFMSPEHMGKIKHDIARSLPSDKDVLKTFQLYKQIAQPFWGLLIDIEDFEAKLCVYLEERSASVSKAGTVIKGVSSAWLGMLFAVLAVATNYLDAPYAKRLAISQTYVSSSFHCLRLSNFLVRPSIESLQAMLNLGFVLANNTAEASWALVGLTCRLAQSLGLHRGPNENTRIPGAKENDLPRRKLWWTILWQDSLLSLSYDRTPITTMTRCQLPLGPTALTEGFTYTEAMYHLCHKIMVSVTMDSPTQPDFTQIIKDCADVEHIRTQVTSSLRTKEACKTAQDRLQHFALILHTSFVVSVLCRPALRRGESVGMNMAQKTILAKRCKQNLTETVRHYLMMHKLSVIPTRSWAFTYHGLSSAVLLGILGETKTDPEVRQLQGDLIAALSVTAAKEQTSSHVSKDRDIELSGPLSRALAALKNIYNHGWVAESKQKPQQPTQFQQEPPSFEQQDAALAMASMQHGAILPPMQYQQQMPSVGVPSIQPVDPNLSMSPMDLFDSIFCWEPLPGQVNEGVPLDYTNPPLYQTF